ncbi:S-layer homology domain-containing protein [Oscillibacter sp. MSJ-2]|uniref:S-layer homology domain-containing protein n=1 Tax=Dysosmobacter acutus TaxID=2841504 RepID=A0ABS6F748_9FIRM|nr:S-layer homology domain-containing protein [Dysosmobacter acutus]MBU5625888.1 S-layer homology domain-containing protein [Dysosmobacter acutus]
MTHIHSWRRLFCLCLALMMLLTAGATAAESDASSRQADLDFLYETLSTYHPNLFANTPESVFLERKAEIQRRLATVSDVEFAMDLQSLTALARDSHTSLALGGSLAEQMHFYPMALTWIDGKWYLSAAESETLLGRQVTAVNGRAMEEVVDSFRRLLSADNNVKLRRQYRQSCNVAEFYEYLELAEQGRPLVLTFSDGASLSLQAVDTAALSKMTVNRLSDRRSAAPETEAANAYYWSKFLRDGSCYIQYNTCQEDPELPMETFAGQVRSDLDAQPVQRVILDLRNNGGGSDGVIWPLFAALRNFPGQLICLIGESTFSSGIINAVELQEMGAVLLGEDTSGSVSHFASVKSFSLPGSGLRGGMSSKYIDLNTLLDAGAGRQVVPLEPDVAVPQTLDDYLAGRDSCIEYLYAHPERLSQAQHPDAPLTRGRFIGQIHQTAEPLFDSGTISDGSWDDPPFTDLFGIEWFRHPLNWAYQSGVAKGNGDGTFSAARVLTWQEAAVFLVRSAGALNLKPETVRSSPLPAQLAAPAWAQRELNQAWAWGLLPEDGDFAASPTRAQGLSMAQALVSRG